MVAAPVQALGVYLAVPVAGFRAPQAREYLETLPCPPPSTVFGALLSLVGETRREQHIGAEMALALLDRPARSVVLRSVWRVKKVEVGLGLGENKRPDYQELLTGVRAAVWLRPGSGEQSRPSLMERVAAALATPASVERFGGLALGESTHLVDEVRALRPGDGENGEYLVLDPAGPLTLPVWPDHVGSAGTAWVQCRLEQRPLASGPREDCWVAVRPV